MHERTALIFRTAFIAVTIVVVAAAVGVAVTTRTPAPSAVLPPTLRPSPSPSPAPSVVPHESFPPVYGLVTLGDSLTAGGAWQVDLVKEDPYLILLGNAGVGGDTTGGMLRRLDADVFVAHAPDVVIILGGTNDTGQGVPQATTIGNLRAIVRQVKGHKVQPVLMTIPPRSDLAFVARVRALNRAIVALAHEEAVPIVDVYAAVAAANGTYRPEMTIDGVHMTSAGNQAVADAIAKVFSGLGM